MTVIGEERRAAIVREVASLLHRRVIREPYMFTARDIANETGRVYPAVMEELRALAANGVLCMDPDGHDPETGRRVILFWRPEDAPQE